MTMNATARNIRHVGSKQVAPKPPVATETHTLHDLTPQMPYFEMLSANSLADNPGTPTDSSTARQQPSSLKKVAPGGHGSDGKGSTAVVPQSAEDVRRCPNCGKRKRGWRAADNGLSEQTLCSTCERDKSVTGAE